MIQMDFETLTEAEMNLIGQCLRAAVNGPFFPDWEFHTLFGLGRSEVKSIADQWPSVDFKSRSAMLAINNSLNNLIGYPHGQDSTLAELVSSSRTELRQLLQKLKKNGAGQ